MTNKHTFLEKYTSHTLFVSVAKGLCVRDELETEQTATYWPQVPLSLAALLSCSAGLLNRGSWGPSTLWELVLTTASYLQLTEPVCGTGLYNCLTHTCFLWASHLHPIQPVDSQGYTLISSTECTCYLHRCISYFGRGSIYYNIIKQREMQEKVRKEHLRTITTKKKKTSRNQAFPWKSQ